MADADTVSSPAPATTAVDAPLSSPAKKETMQPVGEKIAELNESQTELLSRLQGLKQDLQSWRTKLDTQVKTYKDELSELKSKLNVELEQLRSDFTELRTTLQKQQDDVTASLKNLGMNDTPEILEETECQGKDFTEKSPSADSVKEVETSDNLGTKSSE